MPSRMEKYYGHSPQKPKESMRTGRNKGLYSEIFTYGDYSNIEGVAEMKKSNQVDITQVRELLAAQEKVQNKRQYRNRQVNYEEPAPQRTRERLEDRNYDIRDILKEARENKPQDDKERVLRNTQYNILKNIDLKKELKREEYVREDENEELKEMIQTITNTSMLNKLNDLDLAEDMFSELQDDDTKVGEIKNMKEYIEKEKAPSHNIYEMPDYDKSFFTSSLKLNQSDFDDELDSKKGNVLNTIIIVVLIIIMLVSAGILIINSLN